MKYENSIKFGSLSKLGFGAMRFPKKDNGEIDQQQVNAMIKAAYDAGVNYYDTAYVYGGGASEKALGEALKQFPRDSFFLADKCPAYLVNSKEDVARLFNEQLKKCHVDYFDNYMVHNINKDSIHNYRDNDMYGEILKLKKEGRVKNLGFSFHGDPDMLDDTRSVYLRQSDCLPRRDILQARTPFAGRSQRAYGTAAFPLFAGRILRVDGAAFHMFCHRQRAEASEIIKHVFSPFSRIFCCGNPMFCRHISFSIISFIIPFVRTVLNIILSAALSPDRSWPPSSTESDRPAG